MTNYNFIFNDIVKYGQEVLYSKEKNVIFPVYEYCENSEFEKFIFEKEFEAKERE